MNFLNFVMHAIKDTESEYIDSYGVLPEVFRGGHHRINAHKLRNLACII